MAPASGWLTGQNFLLGLLAARSQCRIKLEHAVEMILDHALVAPSDENKMLDTGRPGLVDDVLQHRPVDDRQHLLRDSFGRRKESGSKPGDWKYSFTDGLDAGRHAKLRAPILFEDSFGNCSGISRAL